MEENFAEYNFPYTSLQVLLAELEEQRAAGKE
jgi:hypothetical protein